MIYIYKISKTGYSVGLDLIKILSLIRSVPGNRRVTPCSISGAQDEEEVSA